MDFDRNSLGTQSVQSPVKSFPDIEIILPQTKEFFKHLKEWRDFFQKSNDLSHLNIDFSLWVALDFGVALIDGEGANFR